MERALMNEMAARKKEELDVQMDRQIYEALTLTLTLNLNLDLTLNLALTLRLSSTRSRGSN